jgi:hypothetical protein
MTGKAGISNPKAPRRSGTATFSRFFLWLVVVGGGILGVAVAGAVARVAAGALTRGAVTQGGALSWSMAFILALSYSAVFALAAAGRLVRAQKALRALRLVLLLPLTVTSLAVIPPLVVAVKAAFEPGWQNLLGALIAAAISIPFAWYYLSLYRRLGRLLAGQIRQVAGSGGKSADTG